VSLFHHDKKVEHGNTSTLASNLRDEKLKSGIILNAINDGVVLVDDQGTIQLFNPAASEITGWAADETNGLDWRLVFKFVDSKGQPLDDTQISLAKSFQNGKNVRDNTANLLSKSGKAIALNFSATPLLDQDQRVTGVVGIFRDVSQERQQENQRAEFISTASHEMRTPVAAIEGYLSLSLNEKMATIDAKAREYLLKAHANTQHLGALFQDLLTSAKAEDGRLTNNPRVVEIGAYLEQLTQDLKFAAEKKGLFTDFTTGASDQAIDATTVGHSIRPLYYAQVDPDRLREVITNVFDNAVKYTDKGRVSIGLTGNDKVIQFYIRDTGNGIPAEDIPHLFQKFYRVDNSATRTIGGTGLGLFICRKIIELYEGRIWAESEIGKGTTFFINLPRLTSARAEELLQTERQSTELAPITP
jgi:PAS domain S-box-containing protein